MILRRSAVLSSRKFKKIIKISILPIIFNLFMMLPGICAADDTEIYSAGASLRPMVLIIMDNSGSMDDPVPYDSTVTYVGSYTSTQLYRYQCIANCSKKNKTFGYTTYSGTFTDVVNKDGGVDVAGQDGVDDTTSTIMVGNRVNYLALPATSKISTEKSVLNNLVDIMHNDVEFGFMKFRDEDGGNLISKIGSTIGAMHGQISSMNATTWTPLAEALTDAGKYFEDTYTGQFSPWTNSNWCQKAFVIIITDGEPTHDTSETILGHFLARGKTIPDPMPNTDNLGKYWDQDGDYLKHSNSVTDSQNNDVWVTDNQYSDTVPQTFLDDVAHYLYNHDLRPDLSGTQNVTTYTIGFTHSSPLLQKTATAGGGLYFSANSAEELSHSLLLALDDIAKKLQTYTAPVVPVTRTSSGDKMYLAFFKPMAFSKFWAGDLQKYGLSNSNQIVDSAGNAATDAAGSMIDGSVPYWSAANMLKTRVTARKIYTYLGTTLDLTNNANSFSKTNTYLTAALLGNPLKDSDANPATSAKDDLINYIHGYDAFNEAGTGIYSAKRDFILGDILHSVPLVVDYAAPTATNPNRYIYFGSNDGMLHCIDDTDGSEVWAFVPPAVLPNLKLYQEGSSHPYLVDGSAKLYQERNSAGVITKAIVIFGQRAGGNNYYALDVTTPASPRYLWNINSSSSGFSELGQTWSDPVIGTVRKNVSGTNVDYQAIIFGAGFDSAQANDPSVAAAARGRGVFIADILSGSIISSFTHDNSAGMDYSIASTVLAVDRTYDGVIDRIYVGDLGGNLWRIAAPDGQDNLINNWGARKLFASNPGADGSGGRKIYYPPDIAFLTNYDYLFFGTGDRDNPRSTTVVDRLYGVKDTSPPTASFVTLTESTTGMVNRTGVVATGYTAPLGGPGWYVVLAAGEKALATPVLFNKYVLIDTFSPNNLTCSVGGTARLYAIGYLTGIYSYYVIGVGIPTEVVLVVRPTGSTAFVGAGGGVRNLSDLVPENNSPNTMPISEVFDFRTGINPISWREVF
jgi:type IV pilus assembly protein PilY1